MGLTSCRYDRAPARPRAAGAPRVRHRCGPALAGAGEVGEGSERRCSGDDEEPEPRRDGDDHRDEPADHPQQLEAGLEQGERPPEVGIGRVALHERVEGEAPGVGGHAERQAEHGIADEPAQQRTGDRDARDEHERPEEDALLGHEPAQARGDDRAEQAARHREAGHEPEVPRRRVGDVRAERRLVLERAGEVAGHVAEREPDGNRPVAAPTAQVEGEQEGQEADHAPQQPHGLGGALDALPPELLLLVLAGGLRRDRPAAQLRGEQGRSSRGEDGEHQRPLRAGQLHHDRARDDRDDADDARQQRQARVRLDELVVVADHGRHEGALRDAVGLAQHQHRERTREQLEVVDVQRHVRAHRGAAARRDDDHQPPAALDPVDGGTDQRRERRRTAPSSAAGTGPPCPAPHPSGSRRTGSRRGRSRSARRWRRLRSAPAPGA